jgi:hypothetical protein
MGITGDEAWDIVQRVAPADKGRLLAFVEDPASGVASWRITTAETDVDIVAYIRQKMENQSERQPRPIDRSVACLPMRKTVGTPCMPLLDRSRSSVAWTLLLITSRCLFSWRLSMPPRSLNSPR